MEHIALENSTMQEQANLITARSDKSSSSSTSISISETTRELFPTTNGGIGSGDDLDITYCVYKRRWFGLAQLVLLNIIVSWDWLSFASVSTTSSDYFGVDETAINWLSTAFLFSFCLSTPVVILTLNRNLKYAIVVSSLLIFFGNWIRYAGTRAQDGIFGVVMLGQVLIGLAQPFVLAAPTRYSDLWFTDSGRTSATAVASLANPFGAALGQLICPFWAETADEIPQMILYVSILSTVASIPSLFIPSAPPTPPCPSSKVPKPPLRSTLRRLLRNKVFYFLLIPFGVYVGLFNAISSLLNQILSPYSFSEEEAGICGAVLIVVGLVTSAIISPLVDRSKKFLLAIKVLVPILAASYVAFIWTPETRSIPAPYIVAGIIGASSFALVPITLEFLVEVTFPLSPESPSTLCWAAGQLFGAILIIIMGSMKSTVNGVNDSMRNALVLQAVLAVLVVPLILCLGVKKFGLGIVMKRLEADGKLIIPRRVDSRATN